MKQSSQNDLCPAILASFDNSARLFQDATHLLEYSCWPTAYAVFILAQEEYAKTFLLHLVQAGAIPWNSDVHLVLRNHTCKQLMAIVMYYVKFDIKDTLTTPSRGSSTFPPHVADALNIIRHQKVPREGVPSWLWDAESPCDPETKRIAYGSIDRQKQNALYVGVGNTGQVTSTPLDITEKEAIVEFEKTEQLSKILHRSGKNVEPIKTIEYSKVFDAFRLLFGIISNEDYNDRWW